MNDLIAVEKIAQWQKLKTLVLDSVSSPITKRVYNMALEEFMAWFATRFTRAMACNRLCSRSRLSMYITCSTGASNPVSSMSHTIKKAMPVNHAMMWYDATAQSKRPDMVEGPFEVEFHFCEAGAAVAEGVIAISGPYLVATYVTTTPIRMPAIANPIPQRPKRLPSTAAFACSFDCS